MPRRVMVQVETGDEREGAPLDGLPDLAAAIAGDPRLEFVGISTNYACFRGAPDGIRASVEAIARAAAALRAAGLPVARVSGGNSSLLWLLIEGQTLPAEVTELRCGEALLLGQDALHYRALPGCRTDACVLRAEVLEEYTRPARDGWARRLVLALGRQDLGSGARHVRAAGLEGDRALRRLPGSRSGGRWCRGSSRATWSTWSPRTRPWWLLGPLPTWS